MGVHYSVVNYSVKAQIASLAVVIVLIGAAFGGYYFNTSSVLAGRDQTISSLRSQVNSLVSNPSTSTVTKPSNPITSTVTSTSTSIETVVSQRNYTSTLTNPPPSISTIQITNFSISGAYQIVVDPTTNRVYLFDPSGNGLFAMDAPSHKVVGRVALPGSGGAGIAIDQKLNRIYVPIVSNGSQRGFIVIVDGFSNKIVGNISMAVDRIAVNPNTNTIYGTKGRPIPGGNSSGFLLIIDGNTKSLIANLTLNAYPGGITLNPIANMVYISACQRITIVCGGAEIFAINGTSHVVQSKITNGPAGFALLMNPSTGIVYALGGTGLAYADVGLDSFDLISNKMVALSALGSSCAGIQLMAIDPQTNQIYALGGRNYLLVIDASTGHISSMFSIPSDFHGLAINSNLKEIYLTTAGDILWILNSTFTSSYVNTSLLQLGICLP
jgi:hypothetical protein